MTLFSALFRGASCWFSETSVEGCLYSVPQPSEGLKITLLCGLGLDISVQSSLFWYFNCDWGLPWGHVFYSVFLHQMERCILRF